MLKIEDLKGKVNFLHKRNRLTFFCSEWAKSLTHLKICALRLLTISGLRVPTFYGTQIGYYRCAYMKNLPSACIVYKFTVSSILVVVTCAGRHPKGPY